MRRDALTARWNGLPLVSRAKPVLPRLTQDQMDEIVAKLRVFFNKWTVEIIMVLGQRDAVRFNELKSALTSISGRTLSQRLRDLEGQGLVRRTVFDEMPVRVEYALTTRGAQVAKLALPLVLYLMDERPARG